MNNFYLVTNAFKDINFELSFKIADYLKQKNCSCQISTPKSSLDCSFDILPGDVPQDCQVILVLGGDGTLIRTAGALASLKLPIAGLNLGHLGYLCDLDKSNIFKALDRIIADDFHIENRMMLHGKSPRCVNMHYAINDVVIGRKNSISMIQLKVSVNGEYLTSYQCDGVVVATPTGSTGYCMSANGPIVEPTAQLILLNPLNEHSTNSKCLILDKDAEIEIELVQRRQDRPEQATVSCDGSEKGTLNVGDKIRIRRSRTCVKILKLHHGTFLETLRRKMEV